MTKNAQIRRQQILDMLPATYDEIEQALGYTHAGSFTQLRNLMREGLIYRNHNKYYKIQRLDLR